MVRYLPLLLLMALSWGCSRKKNTFTSRAYHNTTAHYNAYFNGRELVKAHLKSVETGYKEDFAFILPIYINGTEDQAKSANESMEEVIKKCSKVIQRHSIYDKKKKKEHNKWIDDSYLLIAKAKFYKREYYGAIEIFEYVVRAFKDDPSRYEALIWLSRCYLGLEDYSEVLRTLDLMKENKVPEQYRSDYYAVYADYFIQKEEYEEAAVKLIASIEHTRKKKIRTRYTYIVAQLYHELKNYANATRYYGKVLKLRPPYPMEFAARLNQARSYDVSANNSEQIKKRLRKMLRDKKNVEYRDQIYFAMAEMAFREGDEELGMEYLKKCVATSMGNNRVKAEAYLLLGGIYFDKPKYVISYSYYDSCMTIIDQAHVKYEAVKDRKESLEGLVKNILIVREEDSLQRVANMDEKERDKLIRNLVREAELEEQRKQELLERGFADSYETGNDQRGGGGQAGQWYIYNATVRSFGVGEFKKIWGDRALEDNWRRSNKETRLEFAQEEEEQALDSTEQELTPLDAEYYLAQLPLTDSALSVSHNLIIDALYQVGSIFREDFEDYPRAIEVFERLVDTYDTCRHTPSSYYQLYRINLIIEDNARATYYKDLILKKYPFSEFARIIKNPSYLKNRRDAKEQVAAYYKATYQLYEYKQYRDVIETCEKADNLFGDNHLKPKFDFLKALAIGKLESREKFKEALQEVVVNHPTDEVKPAAQAIIAKLDQKEEKEEKVEDLYSSDLSGEHIFVLVAPNSGKKVRDLKIALSDFNRLSYASHNLSVNAVLLGDEQQMISVRRFKNSRLAMTYYENAVINDGLVNALEGEEHQMFIITTDNFAAFYQDKNVQDYLSFFSKNYLANLP